MFLQDRINVLVELGKRVSGLSEDKLAMLIREAGNQNAWFTERSLRSSIAGISKFLHEDTLVSWTDKYNLENVEAKNIGLVTAGNLPLVGFHDLMVVLLSGHNLMIKMSSEDQVLMKYVIDQLIDIDQQMSDRINIEERLNDADAFIATGSDNTARYFKYYFKNKPHVIRSNRISVAVLSGQETADELHGLGHDIFEYYGLGCRNVSKLFIPEGYDIKGLLDHLNAFAYVGDHHKFRNNYDYNKSIYLVNREPHFDTGFALLRESSDLVSPIAVIYYEFYEDQSQLSRLLNESIEKIQCIVSHDHVPFGKAQYPEVDDYADGVDTLQFLTSL